MLFASCRPGVHRDAEAALDVAEVVQPISADEYQHRDDMSARARPEQVLRPAGVIQSQPVGDKVHFLNRRLPMAVARAIKTAVTNALKYHW